jgi:hypothetical protein
MPCGSLAHVLANFRLDPRFCAKPGGPVQALARRGTTLYVGGFFTKLGGARRVAFGALDTRSGEVLSWHPPLRARYGLRDDEGRIGLAVSGTSVFLLGPFFSFGNVKRETLAAVDSKTGALQQWNPRIPMVPVGGHEETVVHEIAASARAVYITGRFVAVDGESRNGVAALDPRSGALSPWNPGAKNASVSAVTVVGDRLYVGGQLNRVAGGAQANLAAFDASTGARLAWATHERSVVTVVAGSTAAVWVAAAAGGQTRIDGFDTATGRRLPARVAVRGGNVRSISVSPSAIVVGGDFDSATLR